MTETKEVRHTLLRVGSEPRHYTPYGQSLLVWVDCLCGWRYQQVSAADHFPVGAETRAALHEACLRQLADHVIEKEWRVG